MIKDAAGIEGANHFYHGLLAEEAGLEVVYITARWLNSVTAYRVCELWGTVKWNYRIDVRLIPIEHTRLV
jgi:hypothetical protein